ncbi:MAG: hypothetical protein R2867_46385 [Caldilineaceae bacterium]
MGPLIKGGYCNTIDVGAYMAAHAQDHLRSPEESYYHHLLSDSFPQPRLILDNVNIGR